MRMNKLRQDVTKFPNYISVYFTQYEMQTKYYVVFQTGIRRHVDSRPIQWFLGIECEPFTLGGDPMPPVKPAQGKASERLPDSRLQVKSVDVTPRRHCP